MLDVKKRAYSPLNFRQQKTRFLVRVMGLAFA